jgi:copper chaperone NosL
MRDRARALAAAVVLAAAVTACHRTVPDGPVTIDYDQEACAHCKMLIGDPRYAAQLVTTGGDVLDFDDPGCLMTYLARHHPAVHRIWFRDARADRWLAAADAGFVPGAQTPMGFGLAAVPRATPGALPLAAAEAAVAAHPEVAP